MKTWGQTSPSAKPHSQLQFYLKGNISIPINNYNTSFSIPPSQAIVIPPSSESENRKRKVLVAAVAISMSSACFLRTNPRINLHTTEERKSSGCKVAVKIEAQQQILQTMKKYSL